MSTITHGAAAHQPNLSCRVATGEALDVRRFHVKEEMSSLFEVTLVVLSESPDIDLDAIVGLPARFAIRDADRPRTWAGICKRARQIAVEERGLSTYEISIAPLLWLATQRSNYRVFQQLSDLDIALTLLSEWGCPPELKVSGVQKKRSYRVQYGESDYAFLCRMLEEAGVSFHFAEGDEGTALVLSDAPQENEPRAPKIPFRDKPTGAGLEYVTEVSLTREVRPGRYTVRDHDYRRPPSFKLSASAAAGGGAESRLERYDYAPGAFLVASDKGDDTPAADDKGKYRADESAGALLAERRLEAARSGARICAFSTNAHDLAPGVVVSFLDHPRRDLGEDRRLLILRSELSGSSHEQWIHRCEATSAEAPHRPARVTVKPRVSGVESATVVGRPGEEIHTDEFGRVRVQFHWDREGAMDHQSSCWIHVTEPWSGAGFGVINLPRVGQEVIVDFLGGDPDRPLITGRVYNNLQKVPYSLPVNKTQSGWKTRSTGGGGGYNELMFEDLGGKELVRIQAERDLTELVKHDQHATVGRDRTRLVRRDEGVTIGNDRKSEVGHDEQASVGNDRARQVAHDERVTIGNDRSEAVGHDERREVGNDRSRQVGRDEEITIGNDQKRTVGRDEHGAVGRDAHRAVGRDEHLSVGHSRSHTVGKDEKITVGKNRTKHVKHDEDVSIGNNLTQKVLSSVREVIGMSKNLSIGLSRSTQVGLVDSTVVGETFSVMVLRPGEGEAGACCNLTMSKDKITISTAPKDGKGEGPGASITLEDRTITLHAETLKITGTETVEISGKTTKIEGTKTMTATSDEDLELLSKKKGKLSTTGSLEIAGSDVDVKGKPIKLNC